MKHLLNCWTYVTPKGDFTIVERHSRGVDFYFAGSFVAHYRNPVMAAEEIGSGNHPTLSCAPETGKSLAVPHAVHDWVFVRA
jgi:hypothetical protein